MTNEELKKKIVEILEEGQTPIEYDDGDWGQTYFPTNEDVADALIAAGMKFDAISEREYQGYCAYKIIEPQIKGCFDRERALKGQLAVVYRALLNMTKKYCVAERKIATTKDGWFSCGEVQLALLAHEAIRDAEKELAEEKR